MVSTRPLSRITTPLPERCSPSACAVKASSGIWDCTVTIDLSARFILEAGPPFGKPDCGSSRRRFSVIGLILFLRLKGAERKHGFGDKVACERPMRDPRPRYNDVVGQHN